MKIQTRRDNFNHLSTVPIWLLPLLTTIQITLTKPENNLGLIWSIWVGIFITWFLVFFKIKFK